MLCRRQVPSGEDSSTALSPAALQEESARGTCAAGTAALCNLNICSVRLQSVLETLGRQFQPLLGEGDLELERLYWDRNAQCLSGTGIAGEPGVREVQGFFVGGIFSHKGRIRILSLGYKCQQLFRTVTSRSADVIAHIASGFLHLFLPKGTPCGSECRRWSLLSWLSWLLS